MTLAPIHIIGGGLAGSEAAWQIARRGVPVVLHEMRPDRTTEAHKTDWLAELVCSNSFRSDDRETNAVGLLHEEMRRAGSLIMRMADAHQVPAGGALAVDRDGFAAAVTAAVAADPLVTVERGEVAGLPPADWDKRHHRHRAPSPRRRSPTRSRTSPATEALAFFDAIAPIVHFDTIDMDVAWFQSRYDKVGPGGTGRDYINCPLDQAAVRGVRRRAACRRDRTSTRSGRKIPYFEGCLPIEVMARARAARRCATGR